MLDILKTTEILVGLAVSIFGAGVGLILWVQRQIRASQSSTETTMTGSFSEAGRRIEDVRASVMGVERKVDRLADEMDTVEQRLTRLEAEVSQAPSKEDVHNVRLQLVEMAGTMREMAANMRGQGEILKRLDGVVSRQEDFLLNNRGSK